MRQKNVRNILLKNVIDACVAGEGQRDSVAASRQQLVLPRRHRWRPPQSPAAAAAAHGLWPVRPVRGAGPTWSLSRPSHLFPRPPPSPTYPPQPPPNTHHHHQPIYLLPA